MEEKKTILIAPSILSCDFTRLGSEVEAVLDAGADWIHVDVMDGAFVPNITIGIPVVASLRRATHGVLDVHLMIDDPLRYVADFAKAGSDLIVFHVEAAQDPGAVISAIHKAGKQAGISLKPGTPASAVLPWLSQVELVLVMTVEPGFGGQSFMADQCPKLRAIYDYCKRKNLSIYIEVDGGVSAETAGAVAENGAQVLVAGSAVYKKPDYRAAIADIRAAAQAGQALLTGERGR